MPSFPCDNSDDDFVLQENLEIIFDDIEQKQMKLGRHLTQSEMNKIYEMYGVEPPGQVYTGGHADHEFDQQE